MRTISVEDVAQLLTGLRGRGRSEKTAAEALATLNSIVRFALRNGWIADNPVSKLEADERPHPTRRRQRVLGRDEIRRLLTACPPRYRPQRRSTPACGSPSCSASSGMTSISAPA
jgi:site-specific recombinase XerD